MYSGYMRTGGCTSCGVAPRTIRREQYSRSYYNGFNGYQSNNDFNRSNYNEENYSNNLTQSYVNNSRRLMTPPRNYANEYSPTRYYSPNRNSGGCTECASNSAQNIYRGYSRPLTGSPLLRSTNNIRYNMNRDLSKDRNYSERYGNIEDNDNDNFTFKRSYIIPTSYNRTERNENINMNRTKSPEFKVRRNLLNTRYRNYEENNNINNNDDRINKNNYSMNNNKYSSNIRSNVYKNRISPSDNLYNSVSFNNDYKKFLENNMNRYGNNRNSNNNNNNNKNYNYQEEKNKLYESLTPNFDYRRRNLDISKRRYDYLRDSPERDKNQFEVPKYQNERFIDLTQYNYKSKLVQLIDERKTFFLFIFGSQDYTGKSWCSDCTIAKPLVEQGKRLIENKKYEKEIYFLSIPIDKIYKEDFRDDPFIQLERVPTLILFENGVEKGRLIENDLFSYSTIREFILQVYDTGMRRQYYYDKRSYY